MGSYGNSSSNNETGNKGKRQHWRKKAKRVSEKNRRQKGTGAEQNYAGRTDFTESLKHKTR